MLGKKLGNDYLRRRSVAVSLQRTPMAFCQAMSNLLAAMSSFSKDASRLGGLHFKRQGLRTNAGGAVDLALERKFKPATWFFSSR